jgi:membrane-associated phospholipid phosphatase
VAQGAEIEGATGRGRWAAISQRVRAAVAWFAARPAIATAAATAVVSVVAIAASGLDLAVAGLFFRDGRFPAAEWGPLVDLRRAGMAVTRIVVVGLVLAALGKLFVPMLMRGVSSRRLLFLATSMALGPGIVVNAVLKETWGRPRPWQVSDFGGSMSFFPAWVPGGACPTNCSFPSGEASSAMWLIALAFVVPERWRKATLAVTLAWAVAISLNRMAFGGHFLSDVAIGWGLTATIVLVCRRFFLERIGPMSEARIDDGLAWVGERLLAAAVRPFARMRRG